MTDSRRPQASAPDASDAPPPTPWWSRSGDDEWGAPSGDGSQPAYGSRPVEHETVPLEVPAYGAAAPAGQPGYGSYLGEPAAPQRPASGPDPWSQPSTQAGFPSGAQPWGSPTDTIGSSGTSSDGKGGRRLGVVAALLATALVAGAAGGVVGARTGGQDGAALDPSASLGAPSGSSASVDRAPDSVAGIAAKVMQSTVSIGVESSSSSGTGSGVVIRSDGYILTNNHVVASAAGGAGSITVTFDNGQQELPAEIVGRDPVTDLAVLKVRAGQTLPAASLGRSSGLVVGDPVIAIGSPLGLSGTVTTGIVSALNRTVKTPTEDGTGSNPLFNAIQTDAAINPGNSGGALVNARGEVIGINSAIATLGGGSSPFGGSAQGGSIGVGFAIPIDEARSVAEEIIQTGRATHPSIGVSATNSSSSADRKGALVREVLDGGGAAQAGLRPNDLIVAVDGDEVTSVDELILAIRSHRIGETVTLTYVRSSRDRTAQVTLQDLKGS